MNQELGIANYQNELFRLDQKELSEDFVSICTELDGGVCSHSGLIICFEEELYYFHYDGIRVHLILLADDHILRERLFVKQLEIIYTEEVGAFLGHCEKLSQTVHPQYGFVFNDSYYDSNTTDSYLVNAVHDITTCVGFCIKVIRGFLYNHPEYIKIDDWEEYDISSLNDNLRHYIERYLRLYANQHNTTVDRLFTRDELRRIRPSELLTSAFFLDLPISKLNIDGAIDEVKSMIDYLSNVA